MGQGEEIDRLSVVEQAVERFRTLVASGDAPEPEAFVEEYPEELREAIQRDVGEWQELQACLGAPLSGLREGGVFGGYRLVRPLGRGAYGVVWEAHHVTLGRRVALKILYPHLLVTEPQAAERFHREARAAAGLDHPGIVTVFESGELDGHHFLAQELVAEGRTLADVIARRREAGDVDVPCLVGTFVQVADALSAAHAGGIVHRDVKPTNILISDDGTPYVADFGCARIEDATSLTRSGACLGTPAYMSPEQVDGRSAAADARTDVFSLGVTMYEALTGRRPFGGDRQETAAAIRSYDPEDPSTLCAEVPAALGAVCLRALEKDPEDRYASVEDLAGDLRAWLRGEEPKARVVRPLRRLKRWCRRRATSLTFGAVAAGILVLVVSLLQTAKITASAKTSSGRAALDRMVLLRERGDWQSVLDEVRSGRAGTLLDESRLDVEAARAHWNLGEGREAVTILDGLLADKGTLGPLDREARILRGILAVRLGEGGGAGALMDALALPAEEADDPKTAEQVRSEEHFALALLAPTIRDALRWSQKALAISPHSFEPHAFVCLLLPWMGRHEEAAAELRAFERLFPEAYEPRAIRCLLQAYRNDFDAAWDTERTLRGDFGSEQATELAWMIAVLEALHAVIDSSRRAFPMYFGMPGQVIPWHLVISKLAIVGILPLLSREHADQAELFSITHLPLFRNTWGEVARVLPMLLTGWGDEGGASVKTALGRHSETAFWLLLGNWHLSQPPGENPLEGLVPAAESFERGAKSPSVLVGLQQFSAMGALSIEAKIVAVLREKPGHPQLGDFSTADWSMRARDSIRFLLTDPGLSDVEYAWLVEVAQRDLDDRELALDIVRRRVARYPESDEAKRQPSELEGR